MKDRPILFSAPMIRALLDGRKTQTRRILKRQPYGFLFGKPQAKLGGPEIKCPYGQPGDLLWVRESIQKAQEWGGIGYCADTTWYPNYPWVWKREVLPSIHMPRHLSRLTLEITGVRVERLQDISESDAIAEGCQSTAIVNEAGDDYTGVYAYENYWNLWESINGPGSWDANPWVWVLEFKVHKQNIDTFLKASAA